jgi:PPOX class probable F420-dependent enzyme
MDRDEAFRRVREARVGRVATADAGALPHVVPFVFVLEGDTLYWAVDQKPKATGKLKRLRNIESNPNAQVLVDHFEEDWSAIWWVRLSGPVRILDEGREAERALELLAAKYPQYVERPPQGPVVAIDVARWSAWSGATEHHGGGLHQV